MAKRINDKAFDKAMESVVTHASTVNNVTGAAEIVTYEGEVVTTKPIPDLLILALRHIEVQDELIAKLSKTPKTKVATGNLAMGDIAIAHLIKHPDWSIARIADEMKVARTTPYKWRLFMTAFNLQKEGNKESFKRDLPVGRIDKNDDKSKNLEAWEKRKLQSDKEI